MEKPLWAIMLKVMKSTVTVQGTYVIRNNKAGPGRISCFFEKMGAFYANFSVTASEFTIFL